jgi:hypothetical protein
VNQAECCSGDHGDCPPTSTVALAGPSAPRDEATKSPRR